MPSLPSDGLSIHDLTRRQGLVDHFDVDGTRATGNILQWNASTGLYEHVAPGAPSAHELAGTSGLGASHTVSGLTAGQVLRATGATTAAFQSLVAGDLPTHTHAAADTTSGTFADARINQSSVTQHQAALSIAETQIIDGAILARVGSVETITGQWTFNTAVRTVGADVSIGTAVDSTGQRAINIGTSGNPWDGGTASYWHLVARGSAHATEPNQFRAFFKDTAGGFWLAWVVDPVAHQAWYTDNVERMRLTSLGNFLLGTTVPATGAPKLDVVGAVGTYHALVTSDSAADATLKRGGVSVRHYTNTEESFALVTGFSDVNVSVVRVGASLAGLNSATAINFYTAANNTTVAGTLAADLTGVGTGSLWHFRGDIQIASLGRFDGSDTPTPDQFLRYNGTKWTAETIQFGFASGDVVSGLFTDGTSASFVHDGRTPAGTPTAPVSAPVLTAAYKSIVVDMTNYGALPADKVFEVGWSTDSGTSWSDASGDTILTTASKVIHTQLDLAETYRYRFRVVGATDSAWSPATADMAPSDEAEVNVSAVILASQIATTNLAAISADIGTITAGQLRNSGNTAGVLVSGSLPGTWTRYLNLTGTGTFLQHDKLTLLYDGTALFKGQLDVDNPAISYDAQNAHIILRSSDVSTPWQSPSNVSGLIGTQPTGGLYIRGYTENASAIGIQLDVKVGQTGTLGSPAIAFTAFKNDGTGQPEALGASDQVFSVGSIANDLLELYGDGLLDVRRLRLSTVLGTDSPIIELRQQTTRRAYIEFSDGSDGLNIANEYGAIKFYTGVGGTEVDRMTLDHGVSSFYASTDRGLHLGLANSRWDIMFCHSVHASTGTISSFQVAAAGTGGATDQTDLMSLTLPTLADGDTVRVIATGQISGANDTRTLKFIVGSTTIRQLILPTSAVGDWFMDVVLTKDGTNTHSLMTYNITPATAVQVDVRFDVVELSGAVLKVTGHTINASDEITQETFGRL